MLLIATFIFIKPIWKRSRILCIYLMWILSTGLFTFYVDYPLDNVFRAKVRPDILFWMLTVFAGIGFLYTVNKEKFFKFLSFLFYVNVTSTFICYLVDNPNFVLLGESFSLQRGYSGLYYNSSLSATLQAILLAFRLKSKDLRFNIMDVVLSAMCFAIHGSSMGVAAFLGGLYAMLFFQLQNRGRIIFFIGLLFAVGALYLQQGLTLFTPTARIPMWKTVLDIMTDSGSYYLVKGYGHGSYSAASMLMYYKKLVTGGTVHIQLHCDVLQTLFETGWVGLILWLSLIGDMFRKAVQRKEYWLIYFVVAWFISSCGNFPKYLAIEHFAFFAVLKFIYFNKPLEGKI